MSFHTLIVEPFATLAFMRTALVACLALALMNGAVGTLLVLRRMSLDGEVLGHAVMPGAAVGFLYAGPSPFWAVAGRAGERARRRRTGRADHTPRRAARCRAHSVLSGCPFARCRSGGVAGQQCRRNASTVRHRAGNRPPSAPADSHREQRDRAGYRRVVSAAGGGRL